LLSSVAWYPVDQAIARVCGVGRDGSTADDLGDLRAELGFRRLKAMLKA
jgi:hypothetical protein